MIQMLAIGMPGTWEWAIILVVGLLIFGRRLPEIGRSFGKTIVEFKKGLRDVQDDMRTSSTPPEPGTLPPGQQKPNHNLPGGTS